MTGRDRLGARPALMDANHWNPIEILDRISDRCRDVGNIIFHIVPKHA